MNGNENSSMVLADAEEILAPGEVAENEERGIYSSRDLERILHSGGATAEHVGGSLPAIQFRRVGEAVLARYSERRDPDNAAQFSADAKVLVLDVLDARVMAETRGDWSAAKLYRGQLFESAALKQWTAKKENVGKYVKITYFGEVEQKKASTRAAMKQFTIEEITFGR